MLNFQGPSESCTIRFEKPDLDTITREYTAVDLHFHSHYSDGSNTIGDIADYACKLGIGIAVTDHNAISGALEIDRFENVLSIPGIEVTSCEGAHILIYFYRVADLQHFYDFDVRPYMGADVMSSTALPMEGIIERARFYRCVIIFPHPNCAIYTGVCNPYFSEERLQNLFDKVDGVEVINSGNLNKLNLKCALLGFNLGKSMTGGSDGHLLKHMGRVVTYARCKPDRQSFLDAVKARRNKVVGKEVDLFRKMTSNGYKLKSSARNCPDLFEKNLKYGYTVIHRKSKSLCDNVRRRFNGRLRGQWKFKIDPSDI